MRFKVLFDTNVLISASLYTTSTDLDTIIEHPFSEISIQLLELIGENIRKRIGIVTNSIEEECSYVIEKALKEELDSEDIDPRKDFEIFSVIKNICENRLRGFLQVLIREPIDKNERIQIFDEVTTLYDSLIKQAVELPKPASKRASFVPRRLVSRKFAYDMYKEQDQKRHAQLYNLIYKPVEKSDQMILSEAIYLHNLYKQTEEGNITFFLASCDYHFSPIRRDPFVSDQITKKIQENFNIMCDFPDKIYLKIMEDL